MWRPATPGWWVVECKCSPVPSMSKLDTSCPLHTTKWKCCASADSTVGKTCHNPLAAAALSALSDRCGNSLGTIEVLSCHMTSMRCPQPFESKTISQPALFTFLHAIAYTMFTSPYGVCIFISCYRRSQGNLPVGNEPCGAAPSGNWSTGVFWAL